MGVTKQKKISTEDDLALIWASAKQQPPSTFFPPPYWWFSFILMKENLLLIFSPQEILLNYLEMRCPKGCVWISCLYLHGSPTICSFSGSPCFDPKGRYWMQASPKSLFLKGEIRLSWKHNKKTTILYFSKSQLKNTTKRNAEEVLEPLRTRQKSLLQGEEKSFRSCKAKFGATVATPQGSGWWHQKKTHNSFPSWGSAFFFMINYSLPLTPTKKNYWVGLSLNLHLIPILIYRYEPRWRSG